MTNFSSGHTQERAKTPFIKGLPAGRGISGTPLAPTVNSAKPSVGRTVEKNFISWEEVCRANGGAKTLLDLVFEIDDPAIDIFWAVVADDVKSLPNGEARAVFSQVKTRIVRFQERAGLPQTWLGIYETKGGLHMNLIFIGTVKIARSVACEFRQCFRSGYGKKRAIQRSYEPFELVRYTALKEASPRTRRSFGESSEKGTYPMEGGGDRVILSPALRDIATSRGHVRPWKRTNNSTKPQSEDKRRTRHAAARVKETKQATDIEMPKAPENAIKQIGQLLLFPELGKPVIRVRDYHAGKPSPSVAIELEYRRRTLGFSQREIARRAGITQGAYANAIRGHDGLSRRAADRLKTALGTAA